MNGSDINIDKALTDLDHTDVGYDGCRDDCVSFIALHKSTAQFALLLAKKLQSGEIGDETVRNALGQMLGDLPVKVLKKEFKAMTRQLIEETRKKMG